jgi:dTDP-4-dehydrorhamnose reductase
MKKILLLGKNGQLGYALNQLLSSKEEYEVTSLDSSQLDLKNPDAIRETIQTVTPDILLNAAAYTAVDLAESEQQQAYAINATAPQVIAEAMQKLDGLFIHYSTDYVFDGKQHRPYLESDLPTPQSVYGASKLKGEKAVQASSVPHLIFRTSWVYGERGKNFYQTMRRLLSEREEVGVVDDQVGSPTWCVHLADATLAVLQKGQNDKDWFREKSGLYHMSNQGQTSWYGFAMRIAELMHQQGIQTGKLKAITTSEFPTVVVRPAYSVLDNSLLASTFDVRLPDWQEFFQHRD